MIRRNGKKKAKNGSLEFLSIPVSWLVWKAPESPPVGERPEVHTTGQSVSLCATKSQVWFENFRPWEMSLITIVATMKNALRIYRSGAQRRNGFCTKFSP